MEKKDLLKTSSAKTEALKSAIAQIEKNYGKGSIMRMGDEGAKQNIEVIPTGVFSLDVALGVGGIPKGRIIEIYGPESGGKTTLALTIIAQAQRAGGRAAFIDAEHALDPTYAEVLGVDTENMYISQPDDGEQALDITETLIRSGAVDLIVIDSVAALTPRAEIEGDMGDSHMGLHARLMSQALRKITGITNRSGTTVIFINQIREKIGVMFGNPETTTGGRSLKFYASIRLEIRRTQTITEKGEAVGNKTIVKIVKNKVAPPFKNAEFDIMYGHGISKEGSLIDVAEKFGVIEVSGAWFKYKGENFAQGRENAKNYLIENPKIKEEIEKLVNLKVAEKPEPAASATNTSSKKPVKATEDIDLDDFDEKK